jgi:hypothetical protein
MVVGHHEQNVRFFSGGGGADCILPDLFVATGPRFMHPPGD